MGLHKDAASRVSERDFVGALCMAGSALKNDATDVTAWYLTALALHGLGEVDVALKNLRSIVTTVAESGNPVSAIARIKEIEEYGGEADDLVETLAKMYSQDSSRLEDSSMVPPPLPGPIAIEPWDRKTDVETLKAWGKEALAVAWAESLASASADNSLPYIPLFSAMTSQVFSQFVDALWREVYEDGATIMEQGEPGDAMYLVAEGQVSVQLKPVGAGETQELARLGPGAFLGEMGIVSRAPRAASVVALERTVVLFISRKKMEELALGNPDVGDVLIAFCHARMLENLMRVSPVLSPVPALRRPDVIAMFTTDYVESGESVILEGEGAKGLFLIVSGGVAVSKKTKDEETVLARLGPGDVFGEISLIMNRPSSATVVATEDTALLVLSAEEFIEATGEYPELLKGAFDIALKREAKNNSILASDAALADELILV